jgi:hypothetical protein
VKRVIAVAPGSFRFAVLATIYRDGSICGKTFGHVCGDPEHDCGRMLEEQVAAFRARLPSAELLVDDDALPVLRCFGRARRVRA